MATCNDHTHRQLWVAILIIVMLIIVLVLSGSVIPPKQLSAQTLQDPGSMLIQGQPRRTTSSSSCLYRGSKLNLLA